MKRIARCAARLSVLGGVVATLAACQVVENALNPAPSVPFQPILIDTGDVTDAVCSVEAGLFKVRFSATPGIVRMPMSRDDLKVTCTKDGYETAERTYENLYRMFVPESVVERSLARPDVQRPTPIAGYPEIVRIAMVRLPEPTPPGATPAAPPAGGPTPLAPITTIPPAGGSDFQPIIRLAPQPGAAPTGTARPTRPERPQAAPRRNPQPAGSGTG